MDDGATDTSARREPPALPLWVLIALLAGVALRVALLILPTGAFDSDEAVVGLMARHMLYDRQFPVFYWGQAYGGTIEPALSVPLFAAFGATTGAVKAVPLVLSAIAALLVWRLGKRTVGHATGLVAACAFFVWPANYVWLSTKARGFYWVCLILGLLFHLVALRLKDRPQSVPLWLGLGAVAGLGIWTSPQILFFLVPGALWLLAVLRQQAWRAVFSAPAVLVFGLPWLAFNVRNGFPSLDPPPFPFDLGYVGNSKLLFRQGLPVALGLHAVERWMLIPTIAKVLYIVALVVVVVGVVRRPTGTSLLVTHVVVFALLWGVYPVSGVIGEGRYVMFVFPALVLLLFHGASTRLAQTLLLVGVVALSAAGVYRTRNATDPPSPDVGAPRQMGPLIHALDRRGIDRVYANYWISYRLDFESKERIVATPQEGQTRYEPYAEAVAADPSPAYVFPKASWQATAFPRGLDLAGTAYDRFDAGGFTVVVPDGRVDWQATIAAGQNAG